MNTRNTINTALGIVAGFLLFAGTAHAGIDSLPECYDAVVAACNEQHGNDGHADDCAGNGFDQCDDQFDASVATTPKLQMKQQKPKMKVQRLMLQNSSKPRRVVR